MGSSEFLAQGKSLGTFKRPICFEIESLTTIISANDQGWWLALFFVELHLSSLIHNKNFRKLVDLYSTCLIDKKVCSILMRNRARDIASLCIILSLKTVQISPPILGHFCEKLIFCFSPKNLGLPVLTKYFVKNKLFVLWGRPPFLLF